MSCCSYCKNPGHNIRTCSDPRIWELWKSLMVIFVIPKIGSEFTTYDKWTILGFLSSEYPEDTVRANTIRLTHKNYGTASFVQHHYRNDLFYYMADELKSVSSLPIDMRNRWVDIFTQQTEHEIPTPIPVEASFPIIEAIMLSESEVQEVVECAICQEEKTVLDYNTTNCLHSFCHDCITKHIASKGKERPCCPLCRTPIISLTISNSEHFISITEQFGETACILKDCMDRLFSEQHFELCHKEMIDIILYEFINDHKLIEKIENTHTLLDKAKEIWRYTFEEFVDDTTMTR